MALPNDAEGATGVTLEQARRLDAIGLNLIPCAHRTKQPDASALPGGRWEDYQTRRAASADLAAWFGTGVPRNAAIVVDGTFVVVETDSPQAEAWVRERLPATAMMTKTARGWHRFYLRDAKLQRVPSFIRDGEIEIEVKHEGHYVMAPGSVHPSGSVYEAVGEWPSSLEALDVLPAEVFANGDDQRRETAPPLPRVVDHGGRNDTLTREGGKLRRLGWEYAEINAALQAINRERVRPSLDAREVEAVARSVSRYEPAADTFPLTEAGDAEFFAACYGDVVRFDHRRGRWLLFNGHHWAPQSDGEIQRLALRSIRARQAAALKITDNDARRAQHQKWTVGGESRKRLSNLLSIAENTRPIADAGDAWDADPWLLGVENGVVDLRAGRLRDGRPEDRITMRTASPFDPGATCPLWDRTIEEIFAGDRDLIGYFDRDVGYSLTGDCREEALTFCWGGGANGKGVTMTTIARLLGDYADDLPFSALELQDRSGIPNDIAKLAGKRFVTSSETGETRRLNEARVKALTGRDPITARFLHQEFFTFQPVAKFWLATNNRPVVRDTSAGFWRRIHMVPFTQSFVGREDKTLKDRLREEFPGILARAVRGCLAWQREGLSPPRAVREATDAYRADSMPIARFLDARCVLGPERRATFGSLFEDYAKWCQGQHGTLNRTEFGNALRERFGVDPTAKRSTTFVGVGLMTLIDRHGEDL